MNLSAACTKTIYSTQCEYLFVMDDDLIWILVCVVTMLGLAFIYFWRPRG